MPAQKPAPPDFLIHDDRDHAGVVVVEGIEAGQALSGWSMESDASVTVTKSRCATSPKETMLSNTAKSSAKQPRTFAPAIICMCTTPKPKNGELAMTSKAPDILGYKRENGRVGIRNHVLALPLDDLSNAACEAVANNIAGGLTTIEEKALGNLQKIGKRAKYIDVLEPAETPSDYFPAYINAAKASLEKNAKKNAFFKKV